MPNLSDQSLAILSDKRPIDRSTSIRHMENIVMTKLSLTKRNPNITMLHFFQSYKSNTYTILGLDPGEKYQFELGTKTGSLMTRKPICQVVMTKPLPVSGLEAFDVTSTSCQIQWVEPTAHTCLRGYQIQVCDTRLQLL